MFNITYSTIIYTYIDEDVVHFLLLLHVFLFIYNDIHTIITSGHPHTWNILYIDKIWMHGSYAYGPKYGGRSCHPIAPPTCEIYRSKIYLLNLNEYICYSPTYIIIPIKIFACDMAISLAIYISSMTL